ncbi:sugar phosphate isomerase/epimerase family protein [Tepidibacter hydrothermalis]|uniref:Sugar phosphate isomerase/epimerase n=1 Tax=Tepidibacter hydrothermalis TaxID=3036126 RepID=A0ABY8E8R6_9FIRM|nr:sugar phosphate isomerase/epimerase [Tepidibacter hydrothermalis]WFD09302.1 sugar phosphate isomerase/epimerase [Tepidibacter hydrothermalis]
MRIGYAASVGEKSILDSMEFAKINGFNAVEINMNMKCFFPENYDEKDIENIKKYKRENDIEITMHAPEDIFLLNLHEKVRNAGIDRLKEIIEFGKNIDASRMTIHIGPTPYFTLTDKKYYLDDIYHEEYKNILENCLLDLSDCCENKIKLCVENSGRFTQKLYQDVLNNIMNKKNIFLTWDIGHSYFELYDEIKFFKKNIDKIKTVHVHDVNDISDHQVVGNGKIDFSKYVEDIGCKDKVYILEVRPREKALESLKKFIQIMGK